MHRLLLFTSALFVLAVSPLFAQDNPPPPGFTSLFNGKDFSGWKVPKGDNGHWRIVDGVIDYDAQSESTEDKNLWSEREFGDFVVRVDWRIKETPYKNPRVPIILPDGSHKLDENGKEIQLRLRHFPARRREIAGKHLVLADRLGRSLRLPHG
jgi:hypothetical protein